MSKSKKLYVLYDERAIVNEEDATVLSVADSLAEAQEDKRTIFTRAVIFEYDEVENVLKNGRRLDV